VAFADASKFLKDYLAGSVPPPAPNDATFADYINQASDDSSSSYPAVPLFTGGSPSFSDYMNKSRETDSSFAPMNMGDTQIAGGYNLLNPATWFGQAPKTMKEVNKGVRQDRSTPVGVINDRRAQEIQMLKQQGLY
jgi:hypothetical protein